MAIGLASRVSEDTQRLIAVGSSGLITAQRLAALIAKPITEQKVETLKFESSRAKRELRAEDLLITDRAIMVDDVAVSGRTLEVAASAIEPSPRSAAIGMLFDSSEAYLRLANAGIRNVASGLRYRGERSMVPPLNTLTTLLEYQDRIIALNDKYFYGQKWRTVKVALQELAEVCI